MNTHQRPLQDALPRLLAYGAAGAHGARDALDRQDAVLEFEFAGEVAIGGLQVAAERPDAQFREGGDEVVAVARGQFVAGAVAATRVFVFLRVLGGGDVLIFAGVPVFG